MVEAEALLELGDLAGERGGIAGRALEDLDGDRAAVGRAKQTVDKLALLNWASGQQRPSM